MEVNNLYGCHHSLPDGSMRATNVTITGKDVLLLWLCSDGWTLEDVWLGADIFVATTGNKNTIMFNHIRKMDNNGDHFDKEMVMHGLENYPDVKRITVKPQTRRWIFPETNIGITELAEGHLMNFPSFVMSWWFRNQVMVELKLWKVKRSRNRGVMKI
ncbi:hypothetical protein GOBAR_DD26477 [Gossypium barbadense]|nr:hypothetical protein GOBAR_DD26477 [Gossypium barbadense]